MSHVPSPFCIMLSQKSLIKKTLGVPQCLVELQLKSTPVLQRSLNREGDNSSQLSLICKAAQGVLGGISHPWCCWSQEMFPEADAAAPGQGLGSLCSQPCHCHDISWDQSLPVAVPAKPGPGRSLWLAQKLTLSIPDCCWIKWSESQSSAELPQSTPCKLFPSQLWVLGKGMWTGQGWCTQSFGALKCSQKCK